MLALMLLPALHLGASREEPTPVDPPQNGELGHALRLAQALYATGDVQAARQVLSEWDAASLEEEISVVEAATADPAEAARLAALREVLPMAEEPPVTWRTLFRDRWVGVGLILSGLFLLAAVGAALWPFLRTAYARHRASAAREEDYLASLPPEVLEQLVALAQERQALGQPAGGAAASWQAAAAQVAAEGLPVQPADHLPTPTTQRVNTAEAAPREAPPLSSHVPTWQPAAPAGGGAPEPQPAQPEPQTAQPAPQAAEPEPQAAPAAAQQPAAPEAERPAAESTAPQDAGPAAPPEPAPAPAEAAGGVPSLSALSTEQEPEEVAVLDASMLANLFQAEAEENQSRHVLIRDLTVIDTQELAEAAATLAATLAQRA
ncbi:MAG: hypothetical protein GX657_05455 [Chloroflexi bacterium]|nr:hypothetical protein [Chloroflexota bacterium]